MCFCLFLVIYLFILVLELYYFKWNFQFCKGNKYIIFELYFNWVHSIYYNRFL